MTPPFHYMYSWQETECDLGTKRTFLWPFLYVYSILKPVLVNWLYVFKSKFSYFCSSCCTSEEFWQVFFTRITIAYVHFKTPELFAERKSHLFIAVSYSDLFCWITSFDLKTKKVVPRVNAKLKYKPKSYSMLSSKETCLAIKCTLCT